MIKLSITPLLATLLMFVACNNKPTQNDDSQNVVEDSIVYTEDTTEDMAEPVEEEETSLTFEEYNVQGFSICGNIKVYDEGANHLKTMKMTDTITTFQIVEKTTKMYVLSPEDRDCSQAYFLKIKLDDEVFIADGSQIYTYANEDHIYRNIHYMDENYSLYAIRPFTMGASDEDGLTGCDDYESLIIENEKTGSLHFINGQRDDYYANKYSITHYYLRTDAGIGEDIITVSAKSQLDYVQVRISVSLQEGSASYDLFITKRNGLFYWEVANETEMVYYEYSE